MDNLKTYFIEVVLKKYGPSFVKGAVAWLFVYLGAHQGILNSHGITWDPSGHTLDIDFDILAGGVWQSLLAMMAGSGGLMVLLSSFQHHAAAVVAGTPQSGDLRKVPDVPVVDGDRKGDLKS